MVKSLTEKESSILQVLRTSRGSLRGHEISYSADIPGPMVSRYISKIRKKFNEGVENSEYVYLTKDGYTLIETPECLSYESELRLKRGTSLICNGKFIFQRYKAISVDGFKSIKMKFMPRMKEINKI